MASNSNEKDHNAELTRQQLEEALRECQEQLAQAQAMLNKAKQDNAPTK